MMPAGFIVILCFNLHLSCFILAEAFLLPEIQRDSDGFYRNQSPLKRLSVGGPIDSRMRMITGQRVLKPCSSTILDRKSAIIAAASTAVSHSSTTIADLVAKGLGYVMGLGAVAVYLPIVIKLLSSKSSEGLSLQTWIFNLLGLSLSVYYPFKKGFPISTYIELITVAVQSFFILFLVCYYRDMTSQYFMGIAAFAVVATALSVAAVPASVLNAIQFISIILCNYANVPQILLTVMPFFAIINEIHIFYSKDQCINMIPSLHSFASVRLLGVE